MLAVQIWPILQIGRRLKERHRQAIDRAPLGRRLGNKLIDEVYDAPLIIVFALGSEAPMRERRFHWYIRAAIHQRLRQFVTGIGQKPHQRWYGSGDIGGKVVGEDARGSRVILGDDAAHQPPRHDLRQSSRLQYLQMVANRARWHLEPIRDLFRRRGATLDDAQDAMAYRISQRLHLLWCIHIERERQFRHHDWRIVWQHIWIVVLSVAHGVPSFHHTTFTRTYHIYRTCRKCSTTCPHMSSRRARGVGTAGTSESIIGLDSIRGHPVYLCLSLASCETRGGW